MKSHQNIIIKASWISVVGNAILSALKIFVGITTGSLAVVGDGIDSASDIITSLITLFTAKLISRPPDAKYPYGYAKADTIASGFLSFIIFLAGSQLAIITIKNFIDGQERGIPGTWAIYITIISIIGKFLLSLYLFKVSKKTNSAMLKANAFNMQNDILISGTVLIGLIFTFIIKLPIIDSIIALLVSIWIIRVAYKIFRQSNIELMDGSKDTSNYIKIFKVLEKIKTINNPHRLRIRKVGHMLVVGIDIEVDGDLTVNEAHNISMQVEESIKSVIDNVYDIVVHVEPLGNYEKHEKFGLTESDFKN